MFISWGFVCIVCVCVSLCVHLCVYCQYRGEYEFSVATHCRSSCTVCWGRPVASVLPLWPAPQTLCDSGWTGSPPWHWYSRCTPGDRSEGAHLHRRKTEERTCLGIYPHYTQTIFPYIYFVLSVFCSYSKTAQLWWALYLINWKWSIMDCYWSL